MNNKKYILSLVACALVFGGVGYAIGAKKESGAQVGTNIERGGGGGNREMLRAGARNLRTNGGLVLGEIVNIDKESITIKSQDGGSKIVFYSSSTEVSKMASGTPSDLLLGKNIMVNGKASPDGSIVADSIQLRGVRQ
jgi:hypothetical protein